MGTVLGGHGWRHRQSLARVAALVIAVATWPAWGATPAQQRMTDMMDRLDQQEFQELLERARRCLAKDDMECAFKALQRADKLAHRAEDVRALMYAREDLNRALEADKQARLAAEREAEDARRREEDAEREAALEAQREQARQAAEDEQNRIENDRMIYDSIQNAAAQYAELDRITSRQVEWANNEAARINHERQDAAYRESARRAREQEDAHQAAVDRQQQANEAWAAQREAEMSAEAERERQRLADEAEARRRDEERARQEAERAAAEQVRREREEAERQRQAEEAAKKAEEERLKQADLQQMKNETKLHARKCPDGEGHYYLVGLLPKLKPRHAGCVDVHYSTWCPGNSVPSTTGVAKNFLGLSTDCFFGDAARMDPKPPCPVKEVRVEVDDVRICE